MLRAGGVPSLRHSFPWAHIMGTSVLREALKYANSCLYAMEALLSSGPAFHTVTAFPRDTVQLRGNPMATKKTASGKYTLVTALAAIMRWVLY